jgi:hypothetical protein
MAPEHAQQLCVLDELLPVDGIDRPLDQGQPAPVQRTEQSLSSE